MRVGVLVLHQSFPCFPFTDLIKATCGITTCEGMKGWKELAKVFPELLCETMYWDKSKLVLYPSVEPQLIGSHMMICMNTKDGNISIRRLNYSALMVTRAVFSMENHSRVRFLVIGFQMVDRTFSVS